MNADELARADAILEHHGVKGMKWGTRKGGSGAPGVPRHINKIAKQDATEHARAKMFFGTGAGTRRKLIKATVEARKKADPLYAKAFDHHLANQDLSVHASKAVSERKNTDRKVRTKQQAGAVARRVTGEMGTQAAFVAVAAAGAAYMGSPKARAAMNKAYTTATHKVNAARISNFINSTMSKTMGL